MKTSVIESLDKQPIRWYNHIVITKTVVIKGMVLSRHKVFIALARACMNARDLRKCGIGSTTIVRAMSGSEVSARTAGKIARALGVDVTEIMEDAGIDNSKGF